MMKPSSGFAVFCRQREVDRQAVVAGLDVRTPANPCHDMAAAHDESVTEILWCHWIVTIGARWCVVHAPERNLVAAVVDFEKQHPAALCHVHRLEYHHIGRELDPACEIQGRTLDVGNGFVALVRGVYLEVCAAGELFVGAGIAEGLAVGDDFAFLYFESCQFCVCRRGSDNQGEEGEEVACCFHESVM